MLHFILSLKYYFPCLEQSAWVSGWISERIKGLNINNARLLFSPSPLFYCSLSSPDWIACAVCSHPDIQYCTHIVHCALRVFKCECVLFTIRCCTQGTSVLSPGFPVALLAVAAFVIAAKSHADVLGHYPTLYCATFSLAFAKLSNQLIVRTRTRALTITRRRYSFLLLQSIWAFKPPPSPPPHLFPRGLSSHNALSHLLSSRLIPSHLVSSRLLSSHFLSSRLRNTRFPRSALCPIQLHLHHRTRTRTRTRQYSWDS